MATSGGFCQYVKHKTTLSYVLCGFCVTLVLAMSMLNHTETSIESQLHQPVHYRTEYPTQLSPFDAAYFADLDKRMANANTVIYNRVPKCGSAAMRAILQKLNRTTHLFRLHMSKTYNITLLSKNQTRSLIKKLKAYQEPWLFERHLLFLDVTKYGMHMPMYINLVREPVARLVSHYYYNRFQNSAPMSDEDRNRTFDECVFGHYRECRTDIFQLKFFCGQDDICSTPSDKALARAKHNVDKYYGVIGLTEDLEPSYQLFEKTMPHFFKHMSRVAKENLDALKMQFKTHRKPPASQHALDIMRSRLGMENDFYAFVRQRYIAFLKHYNVSSPIVKS